jgi:hypothetical protein
MFIPHLKLGHLNPICEPNPDRDESYTWTPPADEAERDRIAESLNQMIEYNRAAIESHQLALQQLARYMERLKAKG